MTLEKFRMTLRSLLNEAVRAGLNVDDLLAVADEELHPAFDLDDVLDRAEMIRR